MEDRKIMVEVTAEEYEKIKAGILKEYVPTYEEVKNDLIKNIKEEDIKLLLKEHSTDILSLALDSELIAQIIRRTRDRTSPVFKRDPAAAEDYYFTKGTMKNLKKVDYSQWGEPVIESCDTFYWELTTFDGRP